MHKRGRPRAVPFCFQHRLRSSKGARGGILGFVVRAQLNWMERRPPETNRPKRKCVPRHQLVLDAQAALDHADVTGQPRFILPGPSRSGRQIFVRMQGFPTGGYLLDFYNSPLKARSAFKVRRSVLSSVFSDLDGLLALDGAQPRRPDL